MAERLNRVIELIESGTAAFGPFLPAGSIPDGDLDCLVEL